MKGKVSNRPKKYYQWSEESMLGTKNNVEGRIDGEKSSCV